MLFALPIASARFFQANQWWQLSSPWTMSTGKQEEGVLLIPLQHPTGFSSPHHHRGVERLAGRTHRQQAQREEAAAAQHQTGPPRAAPARHPPPPPRMTARWTLTQRVVLCRARGEKRSREGRMEMEEVMRRTEREAMRRYAELKTAQGQRGAGPGAQLLHVAGSGRKAVRILRHTSGAGEQQRDGPAQNTRGAGVYRALRERWGVMGSREHARMCSRSPRLSGFGTASQSLANGGEPGKPVDVDCKVGVAREVGVARGVGVAYEMALSVQWIGTVRWAWPMRWRGRTVDVDCKVGVAYEMALSVQWMWNVVDVDCKVGVAYEMARVGTVDVDCKVGVAYEMARSVQWMWTVRWAWPMRWRGPVTVDVDCKVGVAYEMARSVTVDVDCKVGVAYEMARSVQWMWTVRWAWPMRWRGRYSGCGL
ncbi:unnamed protein product [Arctogadus glacialis]